MRGSEFVMTYANPAPRRLRFNANSEVDLVELINELTRTDPATPVPAEQKALEQARMLMKSLKTPAAKAGAKANAKATAKAEAKAEPGHKRKR